MSTQYSPEEVAAEVISQGGSPQQAWVAAALVDGIESNGTLDDKNPSSTACGLFQFLTTTWASNGGTQYAPTACQASLSQQVSVYLTASSGNNFYPWSPDLGGSYNGKPISAPLPGSPVANKIADLASGGTLSKLLGNVPTSWADAGSTVPGTPTPNPVANNAAGTFSGDSALSGLSGLETGVDDVLGAITSASWWERVGTGALGLVLMGFGSVLFFASTDTGKKTITEGTKTAEVAAAA